MSAFTDTTALLRAELGDKPLLRAPAPTVAQVAVGWSIWEKAPEGTDYQPRGGVVVHVVPNGAHHPETGEALDRYLVVKAVRADQGGLAWTSLRSDQVAAVDDGNRPNSHTIAGVCKKATQELAQELERRRGSVDVERVLELFTLGARLMAVIARPGTVAP